MNRVVLLAVALSAASCKSQSDAARADAAPEASSPPVIDASVEPEFAPLPPPKPAPSVPPSEWTWKPYRGDKFTVLFPGDPKITELPPEDDKAGYNQAALEVPGGQVSFNVGYTEYSAEDVKDPEKLLDERVNAPRRGFSETVTKRSISIGGHPGRVMIQRRILSGPKLLVYSRLYLVGRRLYSLVVSTLAEGGIGEDVVKKFMDSFKLS